MSLSKLYKENSDFKPAQLLDRSGNHSEPVWGSIVQEEVTPHGNIPNYETEPKREETPVPEQEYDTRQQPEDAFAEAPDSVANEASPTDEKGTDEPEPVPEPLPEPAKPEMDIEKIREESFQSGLQTGRNQAEEDFDNGAQTFANLCRELDQLRETILKNSVDEMRELVLAIAEKIIRNSVQEQCETITSTIKDAIHLAVKSDEFQIQLNPDDLNCIEKQKTEIINQISGLNNIVLLPDSTIERGGCLIESSCCTVDASMASQIKLIRDSIMEPDPVDLHPSEPLT